MEIFIKNIFNFCHLNFVCHWNFGVIFFIPKIYTENFVSFYQISFVKSAFSILIILEDYV